MVLAESLTYCSFLSFRPNVFSHVGVCRSQMCSSFLSRYSFLEVDELLQKVKWDEKGLAVAIAQNIDTGIILMQGFANREALNHTISTRKATFYSRSRSALWTKGETSKNFIDVHDVFLDCDLDSIIYLGKPTGPTCHTGSASCYHISVNDCVDSKQESKNGMAFTTLYSLEKTVEERKAQLTKREGENSSWTKRLLLDHSLLCSKIREEADELCRTLEEYEASERTSSEMADLLYHSIVLMGAKGVKLEDVLEVLRRRFGQSGVEEKKGRSRQH